MSTISGNKEVPKFKIWFSKNSDPKDTWVIQAENGVVVMVPELCVSVPITFLPRVNELPHAFAECSGSLELSNGVALIR